MPCFDPQADQANKERADRLNAATRAGCDMSKVFHLYPQLLLKLSPETVRWILNHEEMDAKRRDTEGWDQ